MTDTPHSLGYLLNRAARQIRRLADSRLKPLGLSVAHLPVITTLADGKALSQKALTESVGIEQPTMAALLRRMERDGVVSRRPDPADGRSALFSLTERTRGRLAAIEAIVESMTADALAALPPERRAPFRAELQAVIARLDGLADAE